MNEIFEMYVNILYNSFICMTIIMYIFRYKMVDGVLTPENQKILDGTEAKLKALFEVRN